MNKVTGVLLETTSIQKFVFASNLLKENLGASHIVEQIYIEDLKETLTNLFGLEPDLNMWKEEPEKQLVLEDPSAEYEIGYTGGGNALLLFRDKEKAQRFVREWSLRLLEKAPGLQTAVAIGTLDLENFKETLSQLFKQLTENKNRYFPSTILTKHGITADCPRSGMSAEVFNKTEQTYISSMSQAKLNAAPDSEKKIKRNYLKTLSKGYTFTNEIDQLGQVEGKSHIAVVHIDGNSMGKRFKNCQSLAERRKLSVSVDNVTRESFERLLEHIIERLESLKEDGINISTDNKDNKSILPIRPIVLGGDDITFVTDGRLGVYLAEKFLQFVNEKKLSDGEYLSACAGVAITKSKYPFFRSYEMAEALCRSAKKEARKKKGSSWLDFHIVYGGFSGTLEEVRKKHYTVQKRSLHFGPYLTSGGNNEKSIQNFKKGLKELSDTEKWPRSKVKELRTVLPLGEAAVQRFMLDMQLRGVQLPQIEGGIDYSVTGWDDRSTPYFDMIELLDFYPVSLLD